MIDNSTPRRSAHATRGTRSYLEAFVGDQEQCVKLRRHAAMVVKRYGIATWTTADDIFQDALARGFGLGREVVPDDLLGWLKRIATNLAIDISRRRGRRRRREFAAAPAMALAVIEDHASESVEIIAVASRRLGERDHRSLGLCLAGLAGEELARASDLAGAKAATDAKTRLYRKLRKEVLAMNAS